MIDIYWDIDVLHLLAENDVSPSQGNAKMELSEDVDDLVSSMDYCAAIDQKPTVISGIMTGRHKIIGKERIHCSMLCCSRGDILEDPRPGDGGLLCFGNFIVRYKRELM
jgi:hypothetical protein